MVDISRRTLLSGAVLVSALGGGTVLGLRRPVRHRAAMPLPPPPVALTAALTRQRQLLSGYDHVLARTPGHAGLPGMRADVAAHGTALEALLQNYPGWRLNGSTAHHSAAPGDSSTADRPAAPGGSSAAARSAAAAGSAAPATTIRALAAASTAAALAATEWRSLLSPSAPTAAFPGL
jgi:hypothetical protein